MGGGDQLKTLAEECLDRIAESMGLRDRFHLPIGVVSAVMDFALRVVSDVQSDADQAVVDATSEPNGFDDDDKTPVDKPQKH